MIAVFCSLCQLQDVSLSLWNVYSRMDPTSLENMLSEVRSQSVLNITMFSYLGNYPPKGFNWKMRKAHLSLL